MHELFEARFRIFIEESSTVKHSWLKIPRAETLTRWIWFIWGHSFNPDLTTSGNMQIAGGSNEISKLGELCNLRFNYKWKVWFKKNLSILLFPFKKFLSTRSFLLISLAHLSFLVTVTKLAYATVHTHYVIADRHKW